MSSRKDEIVPVLPTAAPTVTKGGYDPIAKVRGRVMGLMDKALNVAEQALDGEGVSKAQLDMARAFLSLAPKLEKDRGQPVHLHLDIPRPVGIKAATAPERAQIQEASVVPDEMN